MPAYVVCPHCEHPTVVTVTIEGRRICCRQCNRYFVIRATNTSQRSQERQPANLEPRRAS